MNSCQRCLEAKDSWAVKESSYSYALSSHNLIIGSKGSSLLGLAWAFTSCMGLKPE